MGRVVSQCSIELLHHSLRLSVERLPSFSEIIMACSTAATTTMSRVLLFLVVFWALFTGFDGRALPATSGNKMNSGLHHNIYVVGGGRELYLSTRRSILLDKPAPGGPNPHHDSGPEGPMPHHD
ncbi:hypothetical protein ACJRO7_001887 [Eucalyptus globulus]|uniref:Uncharacterized protein n=1 Tax=Eucalyptus globulus TaxID=34317 RepID=A0ABD3LSH0_EUCGL